MSCLLYLQKRCRLNYRPKDERSDNYFIYLTTNHFISPKNIRCIQKKHRRSDAEGVRWNLSSDRAYSLKPRASGLCTSRQCEPSYP